MSKPKLVIHLDINGTLMPADPIKAQHVSSMLNIHLSKQAFVRESDSGEIVWWNGCPFHEGEEPPPLLPQYRYNCHIREHYKEDDMLSSPGHIEGGSKSFQIVDYRSAITLDCGCDDFTHHPNPGHVYGPELSNLMDTLEWKYPTEPVHSDIVSALTLPVDGNRKMNIFVPSFLSLVKWLDRIEKLDNSHPEKIFDGFVLVIRTFGSDIPRLIPAFRLIAQGIHPDLPIEGCLENPSWFGSLSPSTSGHVMKLENCDESDQSLEISGARGIMNFFESLSSRSVVMVNDDYDWWKDHGFNPMYGKPIFIDLERIDQVRHFLLDDNVNMDPNDSIASVWVAKKEDDGVEVFEPVPFIKPHKGSAMIGTVLLQANLYKSIIDDSSFIHEIKKAFNRYTTLKPRLDMN